MNFIKFRTELQENFKKLSKNAKFAYQVNLDTDELWNVRKVFQKEQMKF